MDKKTGVHLFLDSAWMIVFLCCDCLTFQEALLRLHRFVTGNVLEIKVAGRYAGDLLRAAVKVILHILFCLSAGQAIWAIEKS